MGERHGLAGCIQVDDVHHCFMGKGLCKRVRGRHGRVRLSSSSCMTVKCTHDGHRCQESKEVGNQGSGLPRASLAISPMECLTTKGRAIKANHSDSPEARHVEKQNIHIQHISSNSHWSHHHPTFILPNF